jgi:hypothetical protein
MADDDRADHSGPSDGTLAARLEVAPLDDVTRRRLVSTALQATEPRPSRAWRWLAAAAVVVVVVGVGFAVLRSGSGSDDQTASRTQGVAVAPKSFDQALGAATNVGDFGNLDVPANLTALRTALEHPASRQAAGAPAAAPASPESAADAAGSTTAFSSEGCARGVIGTIVAQGSGTLDGRPVTVVSVEQHGKRSIDALFHDSCQLRHLSGSG